MTVWMKRAGGCGCAAVLAVILVVSMVSWTLSFFHVPNPIRQFAPVPDNVPPQAAVAIAPIDITAPGRTADQLVDWSAPLEKSLEISGQALRAYGNAELIAQATWPECHLRWNTLAGLGWVETRHGTYNGNWFDPSHLDDDGRPNPAIVGIPLDGRNGTVEIPDTDGGVIDGDAEHDRAVGPLQFIPESWARFGSDANGDGQADPNQIDDAAAGAAALLCADGRDLSNAQDWVRAVRSYNNSGEYVRRVADAANSYAIGQPATS